MPNLMRQSFLQWYYPANNIIQIFLSKTEFMDAIPMLIGDVIVACILKDTFYECVPMDRAGSLYWLVYLLGDTQQDLFQSLVY